MIHNYSSPFIATLSRDQPGRGLSTRQSFGLRQRLLALAVLFAVELIAITTWMNDRALGANGKLALQAVIAFSALFLMFGFQRANIALEQIAEEFDLGTPVKWSLLGAHLAAMVACVALFAQLFAGPSAFLQGNVLATRWLLGGLGICLGALALVPARVWFRLLASGGTAWGYALGALLAMWQIVSWSKSLWQPMTKLTFVLVKALLHPIVPDLISDPTNFTLRSPNFAVTILTGCSGIEGLGMITVFSICWLWFFRRECRFPHALLLIPVSISTLWLLNVVRIGVLFLIGNAGAVSVASGGFHSQAGWIAFNAVALGFSLAAQRVRWFRAAAAAPAFEIADTDSAENPTVAYLMPFAAILAAAMISRAASGTFEWLYPLRFFGGAAAIWYFRPNYAKLNWRVGWVGPSIGVLVFALWIGLDRFFGHSDNGLQAGLASLPPLARVTWLVIRTLGAIITAPVAEELAFRGYLIRRVVAEDFESLDPRAFTYAAVLLSSAAFGLLHGDRWLAGTIAGIFYAAAFLWRGRIGDAVAAHAVTNALIAAVALFGGGWYLW